MKTFKFNNSIKRYPITTHKRSHSEQNPFECENAFRHVQALSRHKMIHSGLKPFIHETMSSRYINVFIQVKGHINVKNVKMP